MTTSKLTTQIKETTKYSKHSSTANYSLAGTASLEPKMRVFTLVCVFVCILGIKHVHAAPAPGMAKINEDELMQMKRIIELASNMSDDQLLRHAKLLAETMKKYDGLRSAAGLNSIKNTDNFGDNLNKRTIQELKIEHREGDNEPLVLEDLIVIENKDKKEILDKKGKNKRHKNSNKAKTNEINKINKGGPKKMEISDKVEYSKITVIKPESAENVPEFEKIKEIEEKLEETLPSPDKNSVSSGQIINDEIVSNLNSKPKEVSVDEQLSPSNIDETVIHMPDEATSNIVQEDKTQEAVVSEEYVPEPLNVNKKPHHILDEAIYFPGDVFSMSNEIYEVPDSTYGHLLNDNTEEKEESVSDGNDLILPFHNTNTELTFSDEKIEQSISSQVTNLIEKESKSEEIVKPESAHSAGASVSSNEIIEEPFDNNLPEPHSSFEYSQYSDESYESLDDNIVPSNNNAFEDEEISSSNQISAPVVKPTSEHEIINNEPDNTSVKEVDITGLDNESSGPGHVSKEESADSASLQQSSFEIIEEPTNNDDPHSSFEYSDEDFVSAEHVISATSNHISELDTINTDDNTEQEDTPENPMQLDTENKSEQQEVDTNSIIENLVIPSHLPQYLIKHSKELLDALDESNETDDIDISSENEESKEEIIETPDDIEENNAQVEILTEDKINSQQQNSAEVQDIDVNEPAAELETPEDGELNKPAATTNKKKVKKIKKKKIKKPKENEDLESFEEEPVILNPAFLKPAFPVPVMFRPSELMDP